MSVMVILRTYGITEGVIAIDNSDKKRSKSTKKIAWVHKIKSKPSGGYIMGQQFVVLVLITKTITFPIGFSFYMPDPELSAWNKKNKQLKKISNVRLGSLLLQLLKFLIVQIQPELGHLLVEVNSSTFLSYFFLQPAVFPFE